MESYRYTDKNISRYINSHDSPPSNNKINNTQTKRTAHPLMKVVAFDHKNKVTRAKIDKWQSNVSKWHSRTSNRTHRAVAPPRTPAETFLSLHRKISAANNTKYSSHYVYKSLVETWNQLKINWFLSKFSHILEILVFIVLPQFWFQSCWLLRIEDKLQFFNNLV